MVRLLGPAGDRAARRYLDDGGDPHDDGPAEPPAPRGGVLAYRHSHEGKSRQPRLCRPSKSVVVAAGRCSTDNLLKRLKRFHPMAGSQVRVRPRKPLYSYGYRGFESLPLRTKPLIYLALTGMSTSAVSSETVWLVPTLVPKSAVAR